MKNQASAAGSLYARNLNVVKTYFRKPMSLLVAVLSLVILIFSLISGNPIKESALTMLSDYGLSALNDSVESAISLILTLWYVVTGIVTVCYFMIFFFSKNSNPSTSPNLFFHILHALSIIELIGLAIIAIITLVTTVVFIAMGSSLITSLLEKSPDLLESYPNADNLENLASSYKPTIVIVMAIALLLMILGLVYFNAQTAFLKSITRSCSEPSLHKKGTKAFGTLSILFTVIFLVLLVISCMYASSNEESFLGIRFWSTILISVRLMLLATVSTSYAKHIDDNAEYSYNAAAAAARSPEVNPIATFKASSRGESSASRQSQPYLYGEEENNDPNKKSSYIPEELQQPQYDQNPYGVPMQYGQPDPFMNPQDPFANSPIGNPGGYPPVQNPGSQNPYNNGMM